MVQHSLDVLRGALDLLMEGFQHLAHAAQAARDVSGLSASEANEAEASALHRAHHHTVLQLLEQACHLAGVAFQQAEGDLLVQLEATRVLVLAVLPTKLDQPRGSFLAQLLACLL